MYQKSRIRRTVIERATYVYAILAHVAASASAPDRNKMKARLTCVCVNSCPLLHLWKTMVSKLR